MATSVEEKSGSTGFSQSSKYAWRNPWVIGWTLLVLVVLGVNGLMVSLAVSTNPGLVTQDYYEKGRDYERSVATQIAERSALGWKVKLTLPESIARGESGSFSIVATDPVGMPVNAGKVVLKAYRPSDAAADFNVVMNEIAPGVYQANVKFPLKGLWELNANISREGKNFDVTERITVQG